MPVSQAFLPGESHVALRCAFGVEDFDVIAQAEIDRAVFCNRTAAGRFGEGDFQSALAGAVHRGEIIAGADVKRVVRPDRDALGFGMRRFPARGFFVGDELGIGLLEMRNVVGERIRGGLFGRLPALRSDGAKNGQRAGGLAEKFPARGELKFAFHDDAFGFGLLAPKAPGANRNQQTLRNRGRCPG